MKTHRNIEQSWLLHNDTNQKKYQKIQRCLSSMTPSHFQSHKKDTLHTKKNYAP